MRETGVDAGGELHWRKHNIPVEVRLHPAKLDKGKQAKRVHVLDGIGPLGFAFPGVGVSKKGLVWLRHGGDIPGVTSQGTCAETACHK